MSIERFASGLLAGVISSEISGVIDTKRMKESGDGFAEVAFSTTFVTGLCITASVYLDMPFLVPVIISAFVRGSHESYKFFEWLNGKLIKKE